MIANPTTKISSSHLQRDAFLYVRQSTLKQVVENTESTERQYALRQRARALGWSEEQIQVIDVDLGKSGASSADRKGFQDLVTQVSLGRAGIVLGLEVSRLARNNTDWHRLLEICAVTDTLILDEEGIYHPRDFNDRLLLGLKGTMSEAELHILRARLRGGLLNKARRGELKMALSIGYVHDSQNRIVRDPDQRIRQTIELFFSVFQQTESAWATVRHFQRNQLLFPRRLRGGANSGEVVWGPLAHSRSLQILQHPIYAGAFTYGRTRSVHNRHGRFHAQKLPRDQWIVFIPEAHEGYITPEQFDANVRQIQKNARAHGSDRTERPPGKGSALLQGLIVCANCGRRMTVRYRTRQGQSLPDYVCQYQRIEHGGPSCQTIAGALIDQAIARLLLEELTPANLEISLQVEAEVQRRQDQIDRARLQAIEQLRYESQLAQRRYLKVDPDNRLVASELEADWNQKLTDFQQAQEEYQRFQTQSRQQLDDQMRQQIRQLAQDIPRLWHDEQTPQQERKRMARLLIEDVTVHKADQLTLQIRFKGGAVRTLELPNAKNAGQIRKTAPDVIETIDSLMDDYSAAEIADKLNEQKLSSGMNRSFTPTIVSRLQRTYGLKSRYQRLRDRGFLTIREVAEKLDVSVHTIKTWARHEILKSQVYNDKKQRLYEPFEAKLPKKMQGPQAPLKTRKTLFHPEHSNKVHHEA